jgi:hypothetical protein
MNDRAGITSTNNTSHSCVQMFSILTLR